MLLLIHNLPPNINHKDIENLIVSECGISSVILDNLVREGSGLRVTVGLIDEEDAAIVMRKMNGFFLGENQLFVENVRKKRISSKSYESSQTRLQREYQLFVEDVFKNPTSEQSYKSSKTRPQNYSAASNRGPSNSDLLIKTLLPTPLPQSRFHDQQYGHSPAYDDPNNSCNQATHLLNRTQALESFISHSGQNSEQQQKSRYKPSNLVSSTDRDFRNYSRDLQSSSSKSNRYSPSDFSQRSDRNDDARVVQMESKNSRSYMHEGQRRLERSRSPHYNTASRKVSDRREYPHQNEPYKKENMNSRPVSGILKRRASPSLKFSDRREYPHQNEPYKKENVNSRPVSGILKRRGSPSGSQMQKSKYPRKDPPPAVFSSSQSTFRKPPPTRKHKESYNQASFSNRSSDVGIKSLLDLEPIQPPVFTTAVFSSSQSTFGKPPPTQKHKESYNQASFSNPSSDVGIKSLLDLEPIQPPVFMTAVFSSSKSTFRKPPPTQKHKESYNQASFSNPSSDVGIKSLLDLEPIQPPVFMTDLNKIVRDLADAFQFGKNQLVLPNISQPTASAEFGVPNQNRNSCTGNTKSFISPWDPNFVQFENKNFEKNEASEALKQRFIAVNKIVKQIYFDDVIKITVPVETTDFDTVWFCQNFMKELRLEIRRRIDEMLFGELGVPVEVIVERYKNMYPLNHHRKLLKNINRQTNRIFVNYYNKTMRERDTENSGSRILKTFKHPSKTMQDQTVKKCIYPQIPQWYSDLRNVAVHLQKRREKSKDFREKTILFSINRALFGELNFCAKAGYEMDENAQTDTLTPHLQNYQIVDENLLVITPVEGADLPEFRPLHDFLKLHNVIGLRKFTTRNMCLALLKAKGDCEKLYAMKKTTVGGKVVTFLPIAKATDICLKPIQCTINTSAREMNDNKTSTKHTTVDKNESVIEKKMKVVKSSERMITQSEEPVKSTESIKIAPGAVMGNSELMEKHNKNIEKSPKSCIYPEVPQWYSDVRNVAVRLQKRRKKSKLFREKTILFIIYRPLFGELNFCAKAGYEMDENAQTDTLTPHLQNYQIVDENLLVITPVEGADLPEFRPLHDFLKLHNVIGLRKFTTRNMCLALLKAKGDCEKLYAMKKTTVGGKVVTFLPIAKATDICLNPIQGTSAKEMNDNKTSTKHTTVDKNESVIENKMKVVKSSERMITQSEEPVKSTECIKKAPGAVIGNSELMEKHKNIEKSPKSVCENLEIASNIKNFSTLKANSKHLVDKEMVDIIDTLPDELLPDDDIEVNMDELEDY